jgi:ornithine cyclodeaminase/alanine dehydrogenase-like protein (mu-crystallin family)
MLVLNETTLRSVLDMASCIAAMEQAFIELASDRFFTPLRTRARPDDGQNWMTTMPVLRTSGPRRWALKQMVVSPANRGLGLDALQGTVLLQDGDNGRLLAIADAPTLTAIRTAAVTALATRALANPDARVVAIIGAGFQARAHVDAMRTVLPDATIRVAGRNREKSARFAAELGCELATSVELAVRDADVVCTVTSSAVPVAERAWFKPGCHLNAVGSSKPSSRELDAATVAAASLFVDRREAALAESGDVLGALQEGAITPQHILAELGDVLLGRHPGRRNHDEFTLFKSLGIAAQDLVALEVAMEKAHASGRGTEVAW